MKKIYLLLFCLIIPLAYALENVDAGFNYLNSRSKNHQQSTPNSKNININRNIAVDSPVLDWRNQESLPAGMTIANGVNLDLSGNVYIVGSSTAGISGQGQTGLEDYFIAKYTSGKLSWAKQVGNFGGHTIANGVSSDNNGNIYVAGSTDIGISGAVQTGKADYFISKYDIMGNLIWSKQVGATNGTTYATGVVADTLNNVTYVSGYTNSGVSGEKQSGNYDYFIAKYDYNGNLLWTKQVGVSTGITKANSVTVDSHGNAYIAGFTNKGISGQSQNGVNDYFIAQYDSNGNLKWTKQVGASGGKTGAYGIVADGTDAAAIYVVGGTTKGILNQIQTGNEDYFIVQYNMSGNVMWAKQVGAVSGTTQANGVSTDTSGNVYVAGRTNRAISGQFSNGGTDYFIATYNNSGSLSNTTEVGEYNGDTEANGISANNSNAYVVGQTTVSLGKVAESGNVDYFLSNNENNITQVGSIGGSVYAYGITTNNNDDVYLVGSTSGSINGQKLYGKSDYYLARYNSQGDLIWTSEMGAVNSVSIGKSVSADNSNNIFITGYTTGGINGQSQNGLYDYFIAKYDINGNLLWNKQVGGAYPGQTFGTGVCNDSLGNIYATGYTNVGISGQIQQGTNDYYITKYDSLGNMMWTKQVGGRNGTTFGYGIATDSSGYIYVVGDTNVGLSGQKQTGYGDYFIAKYDGLGNLMWFKQVGIASTGSLDKDYLYTTGVSVGSTGNIYVVGYRREINGSTYINQNYFIDQYDSSGNRIWTRPVAYLGSNAYVATGVSANNTDGIYISGYITYGSGKSTYSEYFISQYDTLGSLVWTSPKQGINMSGGYMYANGISANNNGNIYVAGYTNVSTSNTIQAGKYSYLIDKWLN